MQCNIQHIPISLYSSHCDVLVITWSRGCWLIYCTRALNYVAKCPRGHVITGLLQFKSFSVESLPNERDRRFYGYQRTLFSLERAGEMRKRAASKATSPWTIMFSRQDTSRKCFPQHGLGAESPLCLIWHSQSACAWRKPSGYARLVISCLGGRKKRSTRGKGFEKLLSNTEQFSSALLHCVTV